MRSNRRTPKGEGIRPECVAFQFRRNFEKELKGYAFGTGGFKIFDFKPSFLNRMIRDLNTKPFACKANALPIELIIL